MSVGIAVIVAAMDASTVAATCGVGDGVFVDVGSVVEVGIAATTAWTVASMFGVGVGVAVGSASSTRAATVASISGNGVAGALGSPHESIRSARNKTVMRKGNHLRVMICSAGGHITQK